MDELDTAIGKLSIASLKGRIESTRLHTEALAVHFQKAKTALEKSEIAHEFEEVSKQNYMLRLLLETVELWGKAKNPGLVLVEGAKDESESLSGCTLSAQRRHL